MIIDLHSFLLHINTPCTPPGCLYGDGYVKIFAGLDTEDESNLIAFESGDFDSGELSIVSENHAFLNFGFFFIVISL